jgi:hypothetical protein
VGRGRLLAGLLLVAVLAALAVRAAQAFDVGRHRAAAAALAADPGTVTRRLPPVRGVAQRGAGGELRFRPDAEPWLTVIDLRDLQPTGGRERYLVFLRNWSGWTLAGAARPDAAGDAQVRSAAEPRSRTIFEVIVTRAVDDATSVPHGQPVLHWYDPANASPRARPFDFARGS